MVKILRRKLSNDEEDDVIRQHSGSNGEAICFATGHPIAEGETVEFDHIKAFSSYGPTETNNIAPMCRIHNRAKRTLSLYDFRTESRMKEFFSKGDRLTLSDLLEYFKSESLIGEYGLPVHVEENKDTVKVSSATMSTEYPVYECPVTGWKYFYATLPVTVIDSDDDRDQSIGLQPRYLIQDKVFKLFQHFQRHPVLQPSLGRISGNEIRLFDGQHKAAALLWNERNDIECKIYVQPDVRLLNQTNISAHDSFSQTRFYSSIMVMKLGSQFGKDFEDYKNIEDGSVKSEQGFIDYLRNKDMLTPAQSRRNFRSFLYNAINSHEDNNLASLVSVTNRGNAKTPISNNALQNSIYASFLRTDPVDDDMTSDAYKRDVEIDNLVILLNMLHDSFQWDPNASKTNDNRIKLERILRSRFMKAWSETMRDAVLARLNIIDEPDRVKLLYRDLGSNDIEDIRRIVQYLVDWKIWSSPPGSEIDIIRTDTDRAAREWLRDKGLDAAYLLGVP